MRVHLDTDFGGDPDDACALAMLFGWPDVGARTARSHRLWWQMQRYVASLQAEKPVDAPAIWPFHIITENT